MKPEFQLISGGVTAPAGYRAAALRAGIKPTRKRDDLALLVSDAPAACAGVFTTNRIIAAPVRLCQRRLARGAARAIVINAGNANACTGAQGMADAEKTAGLIAQHLRLDPEHVLVCSTGTIGIPLPMDVVEAALPALVAALNSHGGDAAAKAIMTTDTVDKQIALNVRIGGTRITIGGMAKGAGMIDPNMATLLAFLTTDAAVAPDALRNCLRAAVDASFNRITIDGDQSTNDTVLFLANGMAGNSPLNEQHPDWPLFCEAVREAALDLALKIVKDGEGATKFVTVTVQGAASPGDACRAARVIARSFLVKTSWYGGDPNWGRIMDAVGYSGAQVEEERVEIRFDELVAVCGGQAAAGVALTELAKVLAQRAFAVTVDLHLGSGAYTLYTCDCSEAYVRINAEYMT